MIGCGRKIGPYDCCTVVCGDCLELMKALPNGCVDVVITDPPYGTGLYPTDQAISLAFLDIFPRKIIMASVKVLFRSLRELTSEPDDWLVWWPTNASCKNSWKKGVRNEAEHIAVWGTVLHLEPLMRPTACPDLAKKLGYKPLVRMGDVWRDPSPGLAFNSRHRKHPNEKPVSLFERFVGVYTNPGESILDPFLGSGTTAVAAKKLGRHFLGFEIVPEYCRIAEERLTLVEMQPSLFDKETHAL